MANTNTDHAAFAQLVKTSLNTAKQKTDALRRRDAQLFLANVVSPAIATLIAALAAAMGGNQIFSQAALQAEDGGWRLACILAAIFSFVATISGGLKKQFEDRLAHGNQCVGQLLRLELTLSAGVNDLETATREYGEIIKTYPEFVS